MVASVRVAGRVGEAGVDVQALVEEVLHVFGVHLLGLVVGFGDHDLLRERSLVGVEFDAQLAQPVPEALHQGFAANVAIEGEVGVVVAHLGAEVPRLDGAAAGNPDRRVRLLDRARPDVDVADLVVFAVPAEDVGVFPGAADEVVVLAVLVAQRGWDWSRSRSCRPSRVPTGKPATRRPHDITSSIAISSRHPRGRVVEGNRLAQQEQGDVAVRRVRVAAMICGEGIIP